MKISELDHKNVCILGYGKEGKTTFEILQKHAPAAKITIADGNPKAEGEPGLPLIAGPDYLHKLADFDVIIKSPGIPWRPEPPLKDKLTSATEIFLDSLPDDVRVVGITGTSGKSTTSSLIYQTLDAAGLRVFLAGNIGDPMLAYLPKATPGTTFVLELSSYQLETLKTSPQIAVVTSFFPDHLDYHGGLKPYHEAKKNIARYQKPGDIIFYNPSYPGCLEIANLSAGKKVAFTDKDYPGRENPAIRGLQNTFNLAAAYLVARECGVTEATAIHALETAHGLPHRQEPLGLHHGLQWIDDSAAKTPEATMAAIEALGKDVGTIIIGGLDRGYDFAGLATALAFSPITNVILFPETGPKIRNFVLVIPGHLPKNYFETSDMTEAVEFAAKHTTPGKAVLLSNGSPSYNLFKNFTERAASFKEAIEALDD